MNRKVKASNLTLEKHVAKAIRDRLSLLGWSVHRLTADRHANGNVKAHEVEEPGTPDYLAVRIWNGDIQAVYIETKRTKGGVLRATQVAWQAAALRKGFDVRTFHSYEEFVNRWNYDQLKERKSA